jgi:threonine/homoserine/homoserine lactone efflux protein
VRRYAVARDLKSIGAHDITIAAFVSIVLLHLMGAISPGPAFVMTVRTAAAEGFRLAAVAALGLGAGAVCWALAALVGLNLLFELAPATLFAFKLLGAAFLLWIAWQTIRHANVPLPQVDSEGPAPRAAASALASLRSSPIQRSLSSLGRSFSAWYRTARRSGKWARFLP